MKNIALLASGAGSNVQNLAHYFANTPEVRISLVITNNPNAGVIERCKNLDIPLIYLSKAGFSNENTLLNTLKGFSVDLIVLAGFLLKIPDTLVKAFPKMIVNIHPALLPKFGGKGMYGMHVHRAVKEAGETASGVTIHYVNEHYDQGAIIFQAKTPIEAIDTPEDIAKKVQALEGLHFPKIIETLLNA